MGARMGTDEEGGGDERLTGRALLTGRVRPSRPSRGTQPRSTAPRCKVARASPGSKSRAAARARRRTRDPRQPDRGRALVFVRDERYGTRDAVELLAVCLVLNLLINLQLQHQTADSTFGVLSAMC